MFTREKDLLFFSVKDSNIKIGTAENWEQKSDIQYRHIIVIKTLYFSKFFPF